jgi:hypothetical protein
MFTVVTRRGFIYILPRPPPKVNYLSEGGAPSIRGGASPQGQHVLHRTLEPVYANGNAKAHKADQCFQ